MLLLIAFTSSNFLYLSLLILISFSSILSDYFRLYCFLFGIGNNSSYPWYCSFLCWKGVWTSRARTSLGCLILGDSYGSESLGGRSMTINFWNELTCVLFLNLKCIGVNRIYTQNFMLIWVLLCNHRWSLWCCQFWIIIPTFKFLT